MKNLILLTIAVLTQSLAPLYGQVINKKTTLHKAEVVKDEIYFTFIYEADSVICQNNKGICQTKPILNKYVVKYSIDPKLKGFEKASFDKLKYLYYTGKLKCKNYIANIEKPGLTGDAMVIDYYNRQYKNWEYPTSSSGLLNYRKYYVQYTPVLDRVNKKITASEYKGYRWFLNINLISYFIFSFILYLMLCAYRNTHAINYEISEEVGKSRMSINHTASLVFGIIMIILILGTFILYNLINIDGNRDFLINSFANYALYYMALIVGLIQLFRIKKIYTSSFQEGLNIQFFSVFLLISVVFLFELRSESGIENIGWFLIYESFILMFLIPRAYDTTIAEKTFDLINNIEMFFWKLKHDRKT